LSSSLELLRAMIPNRKVNEVESIVKTYRRVLARKGEHSVASCIRERLYGARVVTLLYEFPLSTVKPKPKELLWPTGIKRNQSRNQSELEANTSN